MNRGTKCRNLVVSTVAAILLGYVFLMFFVAFKSPFTVLGERARREKCRRLMRVLLSATNLFDTVQEAADQFRHFEDPWGHNYNAIVSDEFSNVSFGNISGCSIRMWSSGPNGINENGQGDDVMVGDGRVGFNKGND